jgi:hypothetical protein
MQTESGNQYMLNIMDNYSRWPEIYALSDKRASTILKSILNEFIPRYSCPKVLISENGPDLTGSEMTRVLQKLNIKYRKTSHYWPRSNCRNERSHKTVHPIISKLIQNESKWDEYIGQVLSAMRTNINESTGSSQYFLVYGRHPMLPMDNLMKCRQFYRGDNPVEIELQNMHVAQRAYHRKLNKQVTKRQIEIDRTEIPKLKVGQSGLYFN